MVQQALKWSSEEASGDTAFGVVTEATLKRLERNCQNYFS